VTEPAGVEKAIGVRVLALCGESLLIEGIKASLQERERVEIALLDTTRPDTIQVLDKLSPDIILFDLTPSQLSSVFTFLRTHTDVVLIGLEIDSDLALFLSGEWRMVTTVDDLMQLIEASIQMKKGR
jgi:DNA-binding NarL/FixJ family response regulator